MSEATGLPDLPDPRLRAHRGGPERASFSVELETVTPILGGAPVTRTADKARPVDRIDVIRVPAIRGHLRFWWRALYGHLDRPEAELFNTEAELWGKAADTDGVGRSPIEISIERRCEEDEWPCDGEIDDTNGTVDDPESYALWPAYVSKKALERGDSPAERRKPGVRFCLNLVAPKDALPVLENVVRAWILFGGYGSRTRRGVGSLTIGQSDPRRPMWLPGGGSVEELKSELQSLFAASVPTSLSSFASLSGASLLVGKPCKSGEDAWLKALGWLRQFRQGVPEARGPGKGKSPGRSHWPEADKLRLLTGLHNIHHPPLYTDKKAAWPRAEFGLPIVGQFHFKDPGEPPAFELTWEDAKGKPQDRMASPLIVKALPTIQGFRPCALWFNRSNPPGKVFAREAKMDNKTKQKPRIAHSEADFGLGSAADAKDFVTRKAPVASYASLKDAFVAFAQSDGAVAVFP